jgi:hypothetical protein
MKPTFVRALAVAGAIALAFAIGHSPPPATAVPAAAPDCQAQPTQPTQPTPPALTPLAHGHLVPV